MHDKPSAIRRESDQPIIIVAGDRYRILATAEDTRGAYALWHAFIPPGGGPPLHVHSREDERFDVLKGTLTFVAGEDRFHAHTGDSVYGPRGVPHGFRNLTDQPAEMLLHVTPGGMEEMFFQTGRVASSSNEMPNSMTADEIGRLREICPRFGIELLGPPIE